MAADPSPPSDTLAYPAAAADALAARIAAALDRIEATRRTDAAHRQRLEGAVADSIADLDALLGRATGSAD